MTSDTGPDDASRLQDLERANAELLAANARLARDCVGASDSAAAAQLNKQARLRDELEAAIRAEYEEKLARDTAERKEWVAGLKAQIADHKQAIAQMESTRAWRLATAYRARRDRLRALIRL